MKVLIKNPKSTINPSPYAAKISSILSSANKPLPSHLTPLKAIHPSKMIPEYSAVSLKLN